MHLAIFDLDRTLTRIGTYTPFLVFAAWRRAPLRLALLPVWLVLMLGYVMGIFGRKSLKEFGFLLLLGRRVPCDDMATLAASYARHVLEKNVHPAAIRLVQTEKAAGARLLLATASPDYYALPLAQALGIGEDDVIATIQARDAHGGYIWRIASSNCYGHDKLARIEQWLETHALARDSLTTSFYSDSASDMPSFVWADQRVAVNPSGKLRRIALERHWSVKKFA